MKVCHITSVHPMMDGRIFEKECSSLAKAGYEVYIVGVGTTGEKNGVQFIGIEEHQPRRFYRFLKLDSKVVDKALSLECDIYHIHDPELLRFAGKIKKRGYKVIFDSHEDVPRQIYSKYWIPKIIRKIISCTYEFVEKRICKKIDMVVAATPKISSIFQKYKINCEVIHNYPVEKMDIDMQHTRGSNIICFAGGLSQSNGIIQLIDVVKELGDVKLKLAGTFEPIVKKYYEINKNENIEFLGYLDQKGINALYQQSCIGIVVDLPTGNNIDGLPIKLFEYMNCGLPIITSNFPLRKSIFSKYECGKMIDPYDKYAYKRAIRDMLKDEVYREKCIKNGRKAITNEFNWERESKKLIGIYKRLMERG